MMVKKVNLTNDALTNYDPHAQIIEMVKRINDEKFLRRIYNLVQYLYVRDV